MRIHEAGHYQFPDQLGVPSYGETFIFPRNSLLQRILRGGTKRFVKGGGVAGPHWRTGPQPQEDFTGDLIAVEGVATAATVRHLSDCAVWAAMSEAEPSGTDRPHTFNGIPPTSL